VEVKGVNSLAFDHLQVLIWVEIGNPSIFFPIHLMFPLQLPQQRSFHDRVGLLLLLIDFHWLSSQKPQGLEEILEFLGKIR